ncbi:hypothetical protein [Neosynechococcus sphagnicola]|nr:hypothetical protein [Neosynechococcus sphagnicola]
MKTPGIKLSVGKSPSGHLGLMLFDKNGLLIQGIDSLGNTVEDQDCVQSIFLAIGLRMMLASSFALEGLEYFTIRLKAQSALLVRCSTGDYLALISAQPRHVFSPGEVDWLRQTSVTQFREQVGALAA